MAFSEHATDVLCAHNSHKALGLERCRRQFGSPWAQTSGGTPILRHLAERAAYSPRSCRDVHISTSVNRRFTIDGVILLLKEGVVGRYLVPTLGSHGRS